MEKLFISRQIQHSGSDVAVYRVFFPICTLTRRVKKCASRKEKGISRRKKVQKISRLFLLQSTDDNTQYCYFATLYYSETVKQQNDFPFRKRQSIINH